MPGQRFAGETLHVEHKDIQPAFGGHGGVFLPQAPGGGVARIFERRFAAVFLRGHQLGEHRALHIYLAAHLNIGEGLAQLQRDTAHGAQVFGDVLAHVAVAARGAAHEHAVFIFKRDRKPVDLGLHNVGSVREPLAHAPVEIPQLLKGERVLQALHADLVPHLGKQALRLPAHARGGGVRPLILRVLCFQRQQLPLEHIVFVIRYVGGVFHVILVAVEIELVRQRVDFLFCLQFFVHDGSFLL